MHPDKLGRELTMDEQRMFDELQLASSTCGDVERLRSYIACNDHAAFVRKAEAKATKEDSTTDTARLRQEAWPRRRNTERAVMCLSLTRARGGGAAGAGAEGGGAMPRRPRIPQPSAAKAKSPSLGVLKAGLRRSAASRGSRCPRERGGWRCGSVLSGAVRRSIRTSSTNYR